MSERICLPIRAVFFCLLAALTACDEDGEGMSDCEGGKLDPMTHLCWQDPPSQMLLLWDEANRYCDDLREKGGIAWRLPTCLELRSLMRGDATVWMHGPGKDGCYWDTSLEGFCGHYWSSSRCEYVRGQYFEIEAEPGHLVWFGSSYVSESPNSGFVRCVYDNDSVRVAD